MLIIVVLALVKLCDKIAILNNLFKIEIPINNEVLHTVESGIYCRVV